LKINSLFLFFASILTGSIFMVWYDGRYIDEDSGEYIQKLLEF
jgi:hypothetical protein